MSFDQIERSNYDGAPITLYEFSLGETFWRYTSGQNDLTLKGAEYTAISIAHEGYTLSGNPDSDDLTIKISTSAEVTALFLATPPSDALYLRIRTLHRGDTEAPVVWSGLVKSGRQSSLVEFAFICNSLLSTLNRNGLRLSWGRGCPHALYDRACGVDPEDFATSVQVTSMTGVSITASAIGTLGDGYLAGGYLAFPSLYGTTERRAIEGHTGSTIQMLGTTDGIAVGDWITVYPGCDRTTATCQSKFDNLPNYGGFPHLPTKSPFDGDPVF